MSQPLSILIVEKGGSLKSLAIKDFKLDELYKKCGFKKGDDFEKHAEWNAKYEGKKYFVEVYGKTDGRAGSENKYDFPPPVDNTLFFGSCALVASSKNEDGSKVYHDLDLLLWKKFYEKLFGGFEDLAATAAEDELEEDELANVPKEKKTKQGYLKDGFVVDSSDTEESEEKISTEDEEEINEVEDSLEEEEDEIVIDDLGSELSEEEYDYSDPPSPPSPPSPPLEKVEPK
jgi:hypothetical protein